ncbi:ribonuclease HII [Trinickia sp.]|uniref:ribonuclease HII n=1 Tax=Trinickia sp. TaxID=2571163 RepID=UPI003F81DE57
MTNSRAPRPKRTSDAAAPAAHAKRIAASAVSAQVTLNFDSPLDIVCGVDEAGRGPLAGPVVAAAVILDPKRRIRGLDDSKALSAKTREALYEKIVERSLSFCVASASVEEIDRLNILHATMLAMKRAIEGLSVTPTLARIDGNRCPVLAVRSEAVIGGDARVPAISAASILAKVTRDRMLFELHERFPVYGFNAHVGYGTPQHLAALSEHGPCEHHRRSFAPVRLAFERHGIALTPLGAASATGEHSIESIEDDALDEAALYNDAFDTLGDGPADTGVGA